MPTESRIVIHRPPSIRWKGELPDGLRALLEREVRAAVERGALASLGPVSGHRTTAAEASAPVQSPSESLEVGRIRPPGDYALPSYADEGELKPLPVVSPSTEASGDKVVAGASRFEGKLVLLLPGGDYVRLGGADRFVEATNFARAGQLGLGIFGTKSFAILHGPIAERESRYWAVATDLTVSDELLGHGSKPFTLKGVGPAVAYSRSHRLLDFVIDDKNQQYAVDTLVTKEREWLVQDVWAGGRLKETFRHPGPGLSHEQRRAFVFSEIDPMVRAILGGDDSRLQEAADRLAQLDVEAYVLVDWQTKVGYLKVLILAWTLEEHEKAIVEIMRSLGDKAQLKAVQAMLAEAGLFDQLFNDLDEELWSLLTTVGHKFGDPGPITFATFIELLEEAFKVPRSLQELIQRTLEAGDPVHFGLATLAELHQALLAVIRFLIGIVDALKLLVTHPLKVIDGIYKLGDMVLTFELAKYGYPKAMEETNTMLQGIGRKLVDGFKGMAILELGDAVVTRIKWALIVEVASWFIGVGEIKAAVASIGLTEKVAAALRFLGIIGKLAEAAEAEVIAARLSRVARAMRGASSILREVRGEEEVIRLLSHLPDEDVAKLGKLLETVEVAEGATLAKLAAHAELGPVTRESMRKIEVLQMLAKKAGGLSEEVGAAFRRLAGGNGFHIDELAGILGALKDGEGARFLAVMERIGFERIGPRAQVRADFLKLLAGDARRMNAVGDIGYSVVQTVFNRAGRDAGAFDAALENVRRLQARMAKEGKAVEFRQLLDKLAEGDPAAWVRVGGTVEAAAFKELADIVAGSEKAQAGLRKLVRGGHDDVARFLARESLSEADRARTVASMERLAELTDKQVDGFAAVMRLPAGSLGGMEREAILTFERGFADPLLDLVGDVHRSVDGGLSAAIKRGLEGSHTDIQGTLGHFYAARTLKERFPGARFKFEVPAPGREIDIQMNYLGRQIDVEIKTNLGLEPSIIERQIENDLGRHIGDRWENMQYLYSPQQAGNLSDVERAMFDALEALKDQGKLPASLPIEKAREALLKRMREERPRKLVDVFNY